MANLSKEQLWKALTEPVQKDCSNCEHGPVAKGRVKNPPEPCKLCDNTYNRFLLSIEQHDVYDGNLHSFNWEYKCGNK